MLQNVKCKNNQIGVIYSRHCKMVYSHKRQHLQLTNAIHSCFKCRQFIKHQHTAGKYSEFDSSLQINGNNIPRLAASIAVKMWHAIHAKLRTPERTCWCLHWRRANLHATIIQKCLRISKWRARGRAIKIYLSPYARLFCYLLFGYQRGLTASC